MTESSLIHHRNKINPSQFYFENKQTHISLVNLPGTSNCAGDARLTDFIITRIISHTYLIIILDERKPMPPAVVPMWSMPTSNELKKNYPHMTPKSEILQNDLTLRKKKKHILSGPAVLFSNSLQHFIFSSPLSGDIRAHPRLFINKILNIPIVANTFYVREV